jgi:hypothetical protein
MGILNNIEPPKKTKPSCHVRTIMGKLDEADQKILADWLDDRGSWSGTAIANTLTKQGLVISATSVNHHRKGQCSCLRG